MPVKSLPKAQPSSERHLGCAADCAACEVRHLAFCAALEDHEIGALAEIASRRRVARNEMIFQEGDPADEVFNLLSGALKLYKLLPDGRRQITGFLFAGDFLGLASSRGYSYAAEAVTDCMLCRFPRAKLEALFRKLPGIEQRLFAYANDELAAAQDQMLLLGRKTAGEKIASFLVKLAERSSRRGTAAGELPLPMSRSDIGDYLGLTIETVSRTMTRFKANGLIALPSPRTVVIKKPEALAALAEG